MAEEKVGFGFEFGIKGDKEVKKGLEDIIRLMAGAGNAASGIAGVLGRAGGLLEFGKMSGAIALAATAMGTFAIKSAEAGENLRRTRFEIDRLSKMPVTALTDSDLAGNESAIIEQFRNLGLEAGNTFQLSFMDRLKNFGQGAYAVNWDVQAEIANLFGAHMQSYEQGSQEAQDAQNRVAMDQKVMTDRIHMAEQTQQSLAAIHRKAAQDTIELYSLNYGGRAGSVGGGVMPESFAGRQRQMDIRRNVDTQSIAAIQKQTDFDRKQLDALRNAPVPIVPGTSKDQQLLDTAKRAQDIQTLEGKINEELAKQLSSRQDILEIELQQRQIARDFMAAQNYGTWRSVGGGGRTTVDPRFLAALLPKTPAGMPTDVGYSTSKNAAAIDALSKAGITRANTKSDATDNFKNNTQAAADESLKLRDSFIAAGDAVHKFVGDLVDSLFGDKHGKELRDLYHKMFGDSTPKPEGYGDVPKRSPADLQKYKDAHPQLPPGSVEYFDRNGKRITDPNSQTSNIRQGHLSDYRGMTASYTPSTGLVSDSDAGRHGNLSGWKKYPHRGDFSSPQLMPGFGPISPDSLGALGLPQLHDKMTTHLRGYVDRHASDFASSQTYAKENQRLGIIGAYRSNLPAHYDPSFHPGSMRHEDILGDFSKRVHGWNSPLHGFNGVPGTIQGLDVLKSIDKNIGKIGIPTLAN